MARTASDLRVLFNVLSGPDPGDPFSVPAPIQEIQAKKLHNLRIGVLDSSSIGRATPESLAAVNRAARLLEQAGFRVEPFGLHNLDRALDLWWFFFGPVIAQLFVQQVAGKNRNSAQFFWIIWKPRARKHRPRCSNSSQNPRLAISSAPASSKQWKTSRSFVPSLLRAAFRHGEGNWRPGTGYRETMRHAQWLNLAGLPGLSVPVTTSADGLPIGVQLIGCPFEEELLLSVAESLELARGSWRPPPIV